MNYRALTVGAVLGFLVALAPSCGPDATCGPANCNGCCDASGTCTDTAAQSATACGTSGATCAPCTGTDTCNAGVCTAVATPDAGPGGCGARCELPGGGCGATCSNGCCDATGQCRGGTADTACGKGSATASLKCADCTTTAGVCDTTRVCTAGAKIGNACATPSECDPGGLCKTSASTSMDLVYSDGYCSLDCGADPDLCPAGSACYALGNVPGGFLGEGDTLCLKDCNPSTHPKDNNGCREDYWCVGIGGGEGFCFANRTPAPGVTGLDCTNDNEDANCNAQQGSGFCQGARADGGTGQFDFVDGYCTSYCVRTNPSAMGTAAYASDDCAAGDYCFPFYSNTDICLKGCDPMDDSTCRDGYRCSSLNAADTEGMCYPDCGGPEMIGDCSAQAIAAGYSCQTAGDKLGYCCRDPMDGGALDCF